MKVHAGELIISWQRLWQLLWLYQSFAKVGHHIDSLILLFLFVTRSGGVPQG